MGSFSIWHWIVVLLVVVLIFGAGKLPNVMGDVAKGIKSFKRNLSDENAEDTKHVTDDGHTKEPPSPQSDLSRCLRGPFDGIVAHEDFGGVSKAFGEAADHRQR